MSQSSGEVNGSLATIQTVGNFLTLGLDSQAGLWEIRVSSTVPYSLKVVGECDDVGFSGGHITQKLGKLATICNSVLNSVLHGI